MPDPEILICPRREAANRVPRARLADAPRCGKCRAALFEGKPLALDARRFDRLIGTGTLSVLVDFWAEWCGPCKAMAPTFAAAAHDLEPEFRLVKIDTEAEPALAHRYAIRSIPTLVLIAGSREAAAPVRRHGPSHAGPLGPHGHRKLITAARHITPPYP